MNLEQPHQCWFRVISIRNKGYCIKVHYNSTVNLAFSKNCNARWLGGCVLLQSVTKERGWMSLSTDAIRNTQKITPVAVNFPILLSNHHALSSDYVVTVEPSYQLPVC